MYFIFLVLILHFGVDRCNGLPYWECVHNLCLGVGRSRNCLQSADCKAMVVIKSETNIELNASYLFDLYLNDVNTSSSEWVAVGLSEDRLMGNDFVVNCRIENSRLSFGNSYNIPEVKRTIELKNSTDVKGVDFETSLIENEILRCHWRRQKYSLFNIVYHSPLMDDYVHKLKYINLLTVKWHILLAFGRLQMGTFLQHSPGSRIASEFTIGSLLYAGCEQRVFLNKYCFGVRLQENDAEKCVLNNDCDYLVIIKRMNNELMFQMIANLGPLSDPYGNKLMTFGLADDMTLRNNFTIQCLFAAKWSAVTSKRNNMPVTSILTSSRASRTYQSLECLWYLSPKVLLIEFIAKRFYLFFTNEVHSEQIRIAKNPISFEKHEENFDPIDQFCNSTQLLHCFAFHSMYEITEACLMTDSCVVSFVIEEQSNKFVLHLIGRITQITNYWFAAAFSIDKLMSNDLVFECISHKGALMSRISWNIDQYNNTNNITTNGITIGDIAVKDDKQSCKFEIQELISISVNETKNQFDFSSSFSYNILLAFGKTFESNQKILISKHDENIVSKRVFSSKMAPDTVLTLDAKSTHLEAGIYIIILLIIVVVFAIAIILLYMSRSKVTKNRTHSNRMRRILIPKSSTSLGLSKASQSLSIQSDRQSRDSNLSLTPGLSSSRPEFGQRKRK